MAEEALTSARQHIGKSYGDAYVPEQPRRYKSKAKNVQEAHEAIRPTDFSRTPEMVVRALEPDAARLYDLICAARVGQPDGGGGDGSNRR
jgi:DNA topoisomerase-1